MTDNEALRDQIAMLKARLNAIEFSLQSTGEDAPAPVPAGSDPTPRPAKRAGD